MYGGDVCEEEDVVATGSGGAYFEGLSSGRRSFLLPSFAAFSTDVSLREKNIQVRGVKLISMSNIAHAKPSRRTMETSTSKPYGRYQSTFPLRKLPSASGCCIEYTERGTMGSGYKKPGGDGRGYFERRG
jgi:hypothetical protein